jgi:hypothetical protein
MNPSNAFSASTVRALEEQPYAAMLAGDAATLERLLDDALTYTARKRTITFFKRHLG